MNRKEALQIICLLDECIDHAQKPEIMLAVDALRRLLLRLFEHSSCEGADGQALLQEAADLPALCMTGELPPSLPPRLCRMTYSLCAPELTQGKPIGLQCREQAEKIRCLRWWGQHMAALFTRWDAQGIQELQLLHTEKLKMMECAFARYLTIWRAEAARRTIMDRSGRLQEIAKLREKLSLENIADTIARCDIAGLEHAKQMILDEIINPQLHKDLYARFRMERNGGLLLFGPPGSGKTMMARAVAAQANMQFFSVRCSDIVGKYFGEAEKHVQALFHAARKAKNAVIFMDEAEALACRRGSNSTVMNRLVPELLSQMDGFDQFDGHIIVIFATNRPYDLDPAFLRPGRLPNHCYIPLPDLEVRRNFLRKLVENRPCQGTIDVDEIARRTERFSCADLVNLVKRGCQRPINRSIRRMQNGEASPTEYLTQEDLFLALNTLHPSVEPEEIERLEKWMKKVGIPTLNNGGSAA